MKAAGVVAALAVGNANASDGVLDDILKVVCRLMKVGSTEAEAEEIICSHMKYNLEVEACDKVIDFLWKGFEKKDCPAASSRVNDALNNAHFEFFMQKYGKHYHDDERQLKFEIFKKNLVTIENKNAMETGQVTYGVNSLSDLTDAEFKQNYLGLQIPAKYKNLTMYVPKTDTVLQSIDWVSRGAVTPVKNQGQCGSCWTFSTTGAIEGAWEVATGRLVSLSEQQIVDCARGRPGDGCSGGNPPLAIEWAESHALCGENGYPYTARDGSCHSCPSPVLQRGSVSGMQNVAASEYALKSALGEKPVSVCVDANSWSYYRGGLFSDCGTSLDHAVLAVGYDSSSWKIKNSWGAGWGEKGYIRLRMGNTCGVLDLASLALVRAESKESAAIVV